MKKCILFIVLTANFLICDTTKAQLRLCVFCNTNEQPAWGPAGFDLALFYYMPDIDIYYSVQQHLFIYQRRGEWVSSVSLPARFPAFDLFKIYKVVINEPEPYLQHQGDKEKYNSFKGKRGQPVIKDKHALNI
jgi:hypothetical protein